MKQPILSLVLIFVMLNIALNTATAQQGFGTATPNADAVIELSATNKGLLMPRVALSGTTVFFPQTATHLAGMTVYNTANAGDVTSGYYYNDGTKWIKSFSTSIYNWNLENTLNYATAVNQDIYQMGKVGIGINTPLNPLHVVAAANPIRINNMIQVTNPLSFNVIFVKPLDGIWKSGSINLPLAYVKKTALSQVFNSTGFNNSPVAETVSLNTADVPLVNNSFVTVNADNTVKILANGVYDIYAIINLLADANNANQVNTDYELGTEKFMSVVGAIEKSADGISGWNPILTSVSLYDVSGAQVNITTTLNPLIAVAQLNSGDFLKLTVKRLAGAYTTQSSTDPAYSIRTSGSGNGVTNSKVFKIVKLN